MKETMTQELEPSTDFLIASQEESWIRNGGRGHHGGTVRYVDTCDESLSCFASVPSQC